MSNKTLVTVLYLDNDVINSPKNVSWTPTTISYNGITEKLAKYDYIAVRYSDNKTLTIK